MLKHSLIFILLLAAVTEIFGQKTYVGYALQGKGFKQTVCADTLNECVDACEDRDGCSAATFKSRKSLCVLSFCGHNVLKKKCNTTTVVFGDPVEAGETMPVPSHDFVMTDRCGSNSFGKFDLSLGAAGLDYRLEVSDWLGKAAHFSGVKNLGLTIFPRSAPHSSLSAFAMKNQSFTVAFFLNVNSSTTGNFCLLEFRSAANLSFFYWIEGNFTKLYYNFVGLREESFPIKVQRNNWYQIVFVYEALSSMQSIYISGSLVHQEFIPFANRKPVEYITVGGRPGDARYFSGSLYCLNLWTEALAPYELSEHRRSCHDGQLYINDPDANKCDKVSATQSQNHG